MGDSTLTLWQAWLRIGDQGAFSKLVRPLIPHALGVARRSGASPQDAEDIVQDCLVGLARERSGRPADVGIRAWFLQTVRMRARTVVRSCRRREKRERRAVRPARSNSVPTDVRDQIEAALELLREEDREALLLRYQHDLEYAEMARILGATAAACRMRVHRAMARVREKLGVRAGAVIAALPLPESAGTEGMIQAAVAGAAAAAPGLGAVGIAGGILSSKAGIGLVVVIVALAGLATLINTGDGTLLPDSRHQDEDASAGVVGRQDSPERDAATPPEVGTASADIDRTLDLHGRVQSESGMRVSGARIVVREYPRADLLGPMAGLRGESVHLGSATTDADGAFRVRLPPARQVALTVSASGWAPLRVFPCYSGERLVLTVRRSARLSVRVVHEGGVPAAAAWVRVVATLMRPGGIYEREAEADEAGRVDFDDVPTGVELSLRCQAADAGAFVETRVPELVAGQQEVTIELPTGIRLVGQVRDARNGIGIAGAIVSLGRRWPRSVTSGAGGGFVLSGYTGGPGGELTVAAKGYATRTVEVPTEGPTLAYLKPESRVVGRVVDEAAEPISGAEVSVTGYRFEGGRWSHTYGEALTGTDGRFDIKGIDASYSLILKAEAPGCGRREIDLRVPDPAPQVLEVEDVGLAAGGSLSGRITTENGGAAPRISIWLQGPKAGTPATGTFGRLVMRRTDDLGRYSFEGLSPGEYQVYVRLRGGGRRSVDVLIEAAGATDEIDLVVPAQWELSVKVLNEQGQPVVGIRVICRTPMGAIFVTTGKNGIAEIGGTGTPEWVSARGPDENGAIYVGREIQLTSLDRTRETLHLQSAGQVNGIVAGPDGKPIAGAVIETRRDGERLAQAVANDQGRFSVAFPSSGTADVVFAGEVRTTTGTGGTTHGDIPLRGRKIGVSAGTEGVRIEARTPKRDGELVVSVVSNRGDPIRGVRVVAEDVRGRKLGSVVTGEGGDGSLRGLPRFEVRVGIARLSGRAVHARTVWADGRSVRLEVPNDRLVVGRVVGAAALTGRVTVKSGSVTVGAARIDADGRFSAYLERESSRLHLVVSAKDREGRELGGTAEDVVPGSRDVAINVSLQR